MSTPVAVKEAFEPLTALPPSFSIIGDETLARRIVPDDAQSLAEIIARNPDINRYMTWAAQVSDQGEVVPALQRRSTTDMVGRYVIVHQDPVVGYIGISPNPGTDGEYSIGYCLDSSVRGKGIAGKALEAMVQTAKAILSPKQLYLNIAPENATSIAIATKHGFQSTDEPIWDADLGLHEQRFRLEMNDD